MRSLFYIATLTLLSTPLSASAKSLKKMSDAELLQVVSTHKRISKRLEAIDILTNRGSIASSSALAQRCQADPAPEVCERVVNGLISMNASAANEQLLSIVWQRIAPLAQRRLAFGHLVTTDRGRTRDAMPKLIAYYRHHPSELGVDLLTALPRLGLKDLADATVFIAKDKEAHRDVRVAALKAAESFQPARLWEAWIALLDDPDSRVRAHCAKELGRTGLPGSVVEPILRRVRKQDVEGNVRAAATGSLAFYAHPGLVSDLNESIVKERHPLAWRASLDLLLPLANKSSSASLVLQLEQGRVNRLKTDTIMIIVRKLAHLGDTSTIPAINNIEQNNQGSNLAKVCRKAVDSLRKEDMDREDSLKLLKVDNELDLVLWDATSPDPSFEPLQIQLSDEKTLIYR